MDIQHNPPYDSTFQAQRWHGDDRRTVTLPCWAVSKHFVARIENGAIRLSNRATGCSSGNYASLGMATSAATRLESMTDWSLISSISDFLGLPRQTIRDMNDSLKSAGVQWD